MTTVRYYTRSGGAATAPPTPTPASPGRWTGALTLKAAASVLETTKAGNFSTGVVNYTAPGDFCSVIVSVPIVSALPVHVRGPIGFREASAAYNAIARMVVHIVDSTGTEVAHLGTFTNIAEVDSSTNWLSRVFDNALVLGSYVPATGDRLVLDIGLTVPFVGTAAVGAGLGTPTGSPADSTLSDGQNTAASTSSWIEIDWEDPPDPPTGLNQTGATPTTVDIEWTAPASGEAPTSYEYRVDGGTPVDVGLVITTEITGLDPSTSYDVEVRTVAATGESTWAGPLMVTTADPPEPPTGLEIVATTTTSLGFVWDELIGADFYQYRIDAGTAVSVGAALAWVKTGLSPDTEYSVEVRASVDGLFSLWSSPVFGTTDAEPPPVIPTTVCSAPVRGSAVRVTGLSHRGQPGDPVEFATSKSVAKVTIREVIDQGSTENLKNPEEQRRLRLHRPTQTIRHLVDINFLRVDPGVLSLVAGVPVMLSATGDVVGFDSTSRLTPVSFGLEVWSKLAGLQCADGQQGWGYTLFPYLRGGRLSGFQFSNGLVSFNLIGAQTRRGSRWGVGPHDIEGPFERLTDPVSRNVSYKMLITSGAPPAEVCGVQEKTDILDNGTATNPMPDPAALLFVDAGGAETDAYIIDGGRA